MKSRILLAVIAASFISAGCELDVPISEMVGAKSQIQEAKRARADKYDAENLAKAEKYLIESHGMLEQEKTDPARAAAKEAYRLAKEAADKSWPLYSKEPVDSAKKLMTEADEMNAEAASPAEYKRAQESIAEADKLHAEAKYPEALAAGQKAEADASAVKTAAAAQIPSMKTKIAELKRSIETIGSAPGGDASGAQLTSAADDLDKADTLLDSGKVKAAAPLISSAEEKIAQAKKNAAKTALKDRIEALKKESASVKASKGSEFAKNDLSAADRKIAEAESSIDDPERASRSADEAAVSIAAAKASINKGKASDRLNSVKKLRDQIKAKDKNGTAAADIKEADNAIAESGSLINSGKFDDSIQKSDKAESILNGVSIALDREAADNAAGKAAAEKAAADKAAADISDKTVPGDGGDTEDGAEKVSPDEKPAAAGRVYIVKYRKKNTDCLWRIAQREYKNPKLWPMIYMANKDQIKDPDLIYPGQKFIIPPLEKKKSKTPAKSSADEITEDKSELPDDKDKEKE